MTTTIVFGEPSDGYIQSEDNSYSTALAGSSFTINDTGTTGFVGQSGSFGQGFGIWQIGIDFDGAAVSAGQVGVTSLIRLRAGSPEGPGPSRSLELRLFTWGTVINTGDWVTPSEIAGLVLDSLLFGAQNLTNGAYMRFGQEEGANPGASYVLLSNRNSQQATPSDDEYNRVYMADASGTGSDPVLYYTTYPESTLGQVLGAQAQLSDGTHVFLEADPSTVAPQADKIIRLRHHDGSTATTIATLQTGSGEDFGSLTGPGAQALAVVVDTSDNIYVLGRKASTEGSLAAKAFTKGSGHNWTAQAARSAAMPFYNGDINNVAAAWHDEGTGGTIVAIVSRESARNTGTDIAYALIDCNHLLTGAGSMLRASGNAEGVLVHTSASGFNNFTNNTGTVLDLVAAPGTRRGFAISTRRAPDLGNHSSASLARYQLTAGGGSFEDTTQRQNFNNTVSKDANAKARIIAISASQFIAITASSGLAGITVHHLQNIGTAESFTTLAVVRLDSEGIASMPDSSDLLTVHTWDVVHYPVTNKVFVYYFDVSNSHRLMRTGVDLNTGLADQTETEINASVGTTGSTNHAIRVHRGTAQDSQVLIAVANEDGGVHSTIYLTDSLNAPPGQPTLTVRANFDADNSALFEWTFNDPNAGDTQSAFQLQINTSEGTSAYDTGKTASSDNNHTLPASTLTNPGQWQWRVRTWDAADTEGPYSDFGTFQTSDSGTVTIVDPAVDNPPDVTTAEYLFEWEVAGTVQDAYRVVVINTSDNSELTNTGWVTSTDTTFLVENMATETEYEVQITVRDATEVETNTATRLITPNYSDPATPSVTVTTHSRDGYIEVSVDNPEPGQELTNTADGTFEIDTDDWDTTNGTLEQTSAQAFEGSSSGLITVTGGPAETTVRAKLAHKVPVDEGRQYTVNFQAYSPSGYSDLGQTIDWLDSADNPLSSSENTSAIASGQWTDRNSTFFAPSGATNALYGPTLANNPPNGTTLYVDNIQLLNASDQPAPTTSLIFRRQVGTTDPFIQVGTTDPNGTMRDYTARSGVRYEYIARAVAGERTSTSTPVPATPLQLQGVWIHDPLNPDDTVRQYVFGKANKSDSIDVNQTVQHFAGREQPVIDHGEHQTDTYDISVHIPDSDTAATELQEFVDFAEARRTLVYRDNRGRGMHGVMSRRRAKDEEWGAEISFVFTRVDTEQVTA